LKEGREKEKREREEKKSGGDIDREKEKRERERERKRKREREREREGERGRESEKASDRERESECLVAWLREFYRTLEIIARTVREVVNRVRLCSHHTRGHSRSEVHVYGAVMWRGGEGGDRYCIDSVLMVGDSDVVKTPE